MKKQQGFTLIELVVVIVILGILAVTAAPKFINLQADARTATLEGVKASMQSAATLVHSKALIAGNELLDNGETVFVTVNGERTEINFGYPLANYTTANANNPGDWSDLIEVSADFSTVVVGDLFYVYPNDVPAPTVATIGDNSANCYVSYTEAADADTLPVYTVVDCI